MSFTQSAMCRMRAAMAGLHQWAWIVAVCQLRCGSAIGTPRWRPATNNLVLQPPRGFLKRAHSVGPAFRREFLLVHDQQEAVLLLADDSPLPRGLVVQAHHTVGPHRTAESLDRDGASLLGQHLVFYERVGLVRQKDATKVGV